MADEPVLTTDKGEIFTTGEPGRLEEKLRNYVSQNSGDEELSYAFSTITDRGVAIRFIFDNFKKSIIIIDKLENVIYNITEKKYETESHIIDEYNSYIVLFTSDGNTFYNTRVKRLGVESAVITPPAATVTPAKMDESPEISADTFGLPIKPIPTEKKTDNINDISYAFYPSESVSYDSVTGEITVPDERTNMFLTTIDNGHFKVKSGSVSNVTLSIADVIIAIMDKMQTIRAADESTNTAFNDFVKKSTATLTTLKSKYSGRDNVEVAYRELFDIASKLTEYNDKFGIPVGMTLQKIKSFFIGPSAIKAIMDSCPLGESVLDSIRFNLNSCFEGLAVDENEIQQFIDVYNTIPKSSKETATGETATGETATGETSGMDLDKKKTWNTTQNELIKSIAFWTEIEYCRVFQLISSDIVGAVNGLTPLRAIIDNTAFTGFINIPRGSGGQIGLDNNVCIYSLFLYNVFNVEMGKRDSQNFFYMEKTKYYELIKNFREKINQSDEFIHTIYGTSNIQQIKTSLPTLMQLLKDESDGVLKGEKNVISNKFTHMFNIYKIITMFAQFIKVNEGFFTEARNALNASYTGIPDVTLENSTNVTWLCFQLTRYQQTQKVYEDVTDYSIPVEPKAVIAYFEERKQQYCEYIKNQENRNIFIKAWYKALSSVYFYEAFAGHDNNSAELVKFAIDVFGSSKYKAPEKKDVNAEAYKGEPSISRPKKKDTSSTEGDDESGTVDLSPNEDEAQRLEFSQFFSQFVIKGGKFSEHPDKVIQQVLKISNCTIFSELIEFPEERILWVVGPNSGNMVDKRELGSGKLPVKPPTVSFMSGIITAAKNGNESTICTTIDLAKYLTKELMTNRSEDIVGKLFPPSEKLSKEEESILFDNQLVEKSLTLAISKNVNTFYVPRSSTVDEAAFDKPQSTIYSTGILRFPIDVGNKITMIVTFRVGIDEATIGTNELYTHTYISPEQLFTFEEMKGDKSPYAVCLAYFYKKSKEGKIPFDEFNKTFKLGPEKKGEIFSNLKYDEFNKTKKETKTIVLTLTATLYDRYKAFLKYLLAVIQNPEIDIKNKNKYYYLFLTVAIPSISSLQSKDIFTSGSGVGGLWRNLIFTIAGDNINVALNFIATIESIPEIYDNPDKAIKRNIDACKEYFTALFKLIKGTTPKFPARSPNIHSITTALQVEFSKSEKTICLRTVENGRPVLKLASIEDILASSSVFKEIMEEERAKGRVSAMEEVAPGQLMMISDETQSKQSIQQSIQTREVIASLKKLREGENPEGQNKLPRLDISNVEKLLTIAKSKLQETSSAIDLLDSFFQNEDTEQLLQKKYVILTTLEEEIKIYESMLRRSSGGGQIGGDDEADYEELYKLEEQLAELKAQLDELLINMVTFTTGPISDLEISKTAALLGPELFERIAQAQNQEIIEEYNKIFALNAGNVPFGENNEVAISDADIVLPEGMNIADLTDNELVMVNYVDGKYNIESADKFFQSFLENYQDEPTGVEGALENVNTVARETVAKGVETVKEAAANAGEAAANAASEASTKVVEVATNVGEAVSNATEQATKVVSDAVAEANEYIKPAGADSSAGNPIAAAAGGYKKQTKKKHNNIKKFTKRSKSNSKRSNSNKRSKSNSKSKKYTRRKNSKKPKKTKRKN